MNPFSLHTLTLPSHKSTTKKKKKNKKNPPQTPRRLGRTRRDDGEYGGSALEYLIVSLFSLLLAIAAIHFVGKVIKKHAAEIESKAGITLELPEIFGEG